MTEEQNEYAPGWRPSAGDEVEGRIIGIDAKERKKPKPGDTHYPILTIESSDGSQVSVHCFHSVLERELKENFKASEIVGSHIKIRYEGERTTKDGENTYHLYKVFGGTRRAGQVAAVLNWGDDPEPQSGSASAPNGVGTSATATAEPPIAPSTPIDGHGPLPPRSEPTPQQQAEQNFGSVAPF